VVFTFTPFFNHTWKLRRLRKRNVNQLTLRVTFAKKLQDVEREELVSYSTEEVSGGTQR
jgi:hypothetical protein